MAGSRRSAPNTTRRSPSSAATAAATSNPGTARVSAADARKTLPKVAASSSTSAAASPQREAATIWRNLLPPGYVPPPRVRGGLAPNPSDGRASAPFTSTSNGTRQLSSSAATASSSSKPKNIQVHAFSDKLKAITSAKTAANASYGNSYALHLPRSATIPLSSIHHHSHSHSYADSSSMHRAPREPVVAGYSYKGAVEDPDKITWTPNGRYDGDYDNLCSLYSDAWPHSSSSPSPFSSSLPLVSPPSHSVQIPVLQRSWSRADVSGGVSYALGSTRGALGLCQPTGACAMQTQHDCR